MLRYFLFSIIILISQHATLAYSCSCFKTDIPVAILRGEPEGSAKLNRIKLIVS